MPTKKKAPAKKAAKKAAPAKLLKETKRQQKPHRVECWFTPEENAVIEKAATIKCLTRKEYAEAMLIHASTQLVANHKAKKAKK